jgi:DNA-binding transcriptional regulator GbsR (MarR family)
VNDLEGTANGPFDQVFGGPVAKVLDQAMYVGNMEQTIPMLVESTGLSFKTVQKAVRQLNTLGLVKRSRKIGNAQTYRFEVEHDMHDLITWAEHFKMNVHRKP